MVWFASVWTEWVLPLSFSDRSSTPFPLYSYLFTIDYQNYKNKRCRFGVLPFLYIMIFSSSSSSLFYFIFKFTEKLYFQHQENKYRQFKIKYKFLEVWFENVLVKCGSNYYYYYNQNPIVTCFLFIYFSF